MKLFTKSKEGYPVKVGELNTEPSTKSTVFMKHRPHLMKIIGPNGGYGIQRWCTDEKGKQIDLLNHFATHRDILVIIHDTDLNKTWYSLAGIWVMHEHKGNYGDGTQIFLSTEYMSNVDPEEQAITIET